MKALKPAMKRLGWCGCRSASFRVVVMAFDKVLKFAYMRAAECDG